MTTDQTTEAPVTTPPTPPAAGAIPILALDVRGAREALLLAEQVRRAEWVKVGLQLFVAAGPDIVRTLRGMGRRVFLDLKLHDIPNTVARAVESAGSLGAELLTLHTSGGVAMMRAAREAAGDRGGDLRLLGVTMLTSLSAGELAEAWGRDALTPETEVGRLANLAHGAGLDGVVAAAHEVPIIRARVGNALSILTPGIRLAGDDAGDQARVATPAQAVSLGADYLVIGRSVTASPDPSAAFDRVLADIAGVGGGSR